MVDDITAKLQILVSRKSEFQDAAGSFHIIRLICLQFVILEASSIEAALWDAVGFLCFTDAPTLWKPEEVYVFVKTHMWVMSLTWKFKNQAGF